MADYICANCGEPIKNEYKSEKAQQCDRCGSWIFVKVRKSEKKILKSD